MAEETVGLKKKWKIMDQWRHYSSDKKIQTCSKLSMRTSGLGL